MPAASVLIVDDDLFEANYVAAVLADRGIAVLGPMSDIAAACEAIRAQAPRAAVVAQPSLNAGRGEMLAELLSAGIPYLTLLRAAVRRPPIGQPVLTTPFAAYQVADWVDHAIPRVSRQTLASLAPCSAYRSA